MTDLLLPTRPSVSWFHNGTYGFQPKRYFAAGADGKQQYHVEGQPVFRSGSFRDSTGELKDWEAIHMNQMQTNYSYLVGQNTLPRIPVRKGHGSFFGDPMQSLVGWHTGIKTADLVSPADGKTYTYILADYYLFDEEAIARESADDWPNRSSEIGTYVNNDSAEYWPVYMGFAYVDFPAVEGLNFGKYQKEAERELVILVDDPKEFSGMTQSATPPAPALPVVPPVTHSFSIGGKTTSDFAAVQGYISRLESDNATLSQFQKESMLAGRNSFFSSLATGDAPKILAGQVEGLQSLAASMDEAQFAAFKAVYEAMPAISLLQTHGQSNGTGSEHVDGKGEPQTGPSALDDQKAIVGRHKLAGTPLEQIRQMASYKSVMAADPTFVL